MKDLDIVVGQTINLEGEPYIIRTITKGGVIVDSPEGVLGYRSFEEVASQNPDIVIEDDYDY